MDNANIPIKEVIGCKNGQYRVIIHTEVFPTTWHDTVFLPLACHGLRFRSLRFSGSLKIMCSDGSVHEVKLIKDVAEANAKLKVASRSYN